MSLQKVKAARLRRALLWMLFLSAWGRLIAQDGNARIYGTVTDFHGQAIEGASVILKDSRFRPLHETLSDKNGKYVLSVPKGTYYCMYAVRPADYRVSRLEYWTWNVPVYDDMEINPQYDRMEIYGINVFEPQVTPQETYMVYFRPMSLAKTLAIVDRQKVDSKRFEREKRAEELLKTTAGDILNVGPEAITPGELEIEVNGLKAKILGIHKTVEYARGLYYYGYNVQILKPKNQIAPKTAYDQITIVLHSRETGESGKGEAFIKRR